MNTSYLDTVLISFSETEHWTIRDAVRGVQIFGSIGSGKTTGSGQHIAKKYIKAGFGGLVLCAKPEEAEEWKRYALECGKADEDIIHFCEGSVYRFNPLQYEKSRTSKGGGITYNITELFMSVFKMGQRLTGSDTEDHERFWENSLKRLINRVVDLIKLSGEELSVHNMIEIIGTAPTNQDELNELLKAANQENDSDLRKHLAASYCLRCMNHAKNNAIDEKQKWESELVYNFFYRDFPRLDDKVQSTIREMFLGFAEPFLTGILSNYFSTDTNVKPEDTFEGKIIILDFSVKEYLVSGVYAQAMFKYLWQQSVERRKIAATTKPVFLWMDESQYFINEYDTIFQTTARSSRACTVLLTQNISNYYAQMGGKNIEAKVDSLLGNLGTLIFHANSDAKTNAYASKLIGHDYTTMQTSNVSQSFLSTNSSKSVGFNTQLAPQVLPKEFTTFRTGGEANNFQTDCIILVNGKKWADGKNYKTASFKQDFK